MLSKLQCTPSRIGLLTATPNSNLMSWVRIPPPVAVLAEVAQLVERKSRTQSAEENEATNSSQKLMDLEVAGSSPAPGTTVSGVVQLARTQGATKRSLSKNSGMLTAQLPRGSSMWSYQNASRTRVVFLGGRRGPKARWGEFEAQTFVARARMPKAQRRVALTAPPGRPRTLEC